MRKVGPKLPSNLDSALHWSRAVHWFFDTHYTKPQIKINRKYGIWTQINLTAGKQKNKLTFLHPQGQQVTILNKLIKFHPFQINSLTKRNNTIVKLEVQNKLSTKNQYILYKDNNRNNQDECNVLTSGTTKLPKDKFFGSAGIQNPGNRSRIPQGVCF